MNMNDLGVPDISALVRFGRLGVQMMASRILSISALLGTVSLGAYAVYTSSWQGVCVTAIMALLVFFPSLKSETKKDDQ